MKASECLWWVCTRVRLKEEARNESLRCLLVLLRFYYHLLGLCYCPILKPRAVRS